VLLARLPAPMNPRMSPNQALQRTPPLCFASRGFPRLLRSLGAAERRR
jgi:hypothetical protein